ncbi:MAG: methylmalonyl-CoA carboxyltransferase [Proteobacteria bacterium]|nr:methylmalonyl-CoA carboxyltransferase [Pseudomonadota bacterium]
MKKDEANKKLEELNKEAMLGGGEAAIARHKSKGKMTARERVAELFDPGSVQELDRYRRHDATHFGVDKKRPAGDSVVTGYGRIEGRLVYFFAHDATVYGGTLSHVHAQKICKVMDMAAKMGAPFIGLNDSAGARIQEGVASLGGYADIFLKNVMLSGVVPQISLIMGPCAGGAVYSPAMTDFLIMVEKTSYMFITGPDVIKTVTHEDVTMEELGGAQAHLEKSGVTHFAVPDEASALALLRELLSYLPQNNLEDASALATEDPIDRATPKLEDIVPEDPRHPYDIRDVITELADEHQFLEVQAAYAPNLVIGFTRLGGRSVGVVANQPAYLSGSLDIDGSVKGARFVRFCDAFNIPLLVLEDVPGFLPGLKQEHGGIIKHGAKLLFAFAEATVPKVTLITRKAYGGAYCVMNSKHLRADFNFAWPTAEIAVMGAEGAVKFIHRKEIKGLDPTDPKVTRLKNEYEDRFLNPFQAADLGFIDAVIAPSQTREILIDAFSATTNKREHTYPKKHGNIPL